jgi:hypothetical protein
MHDRLFRFEHVLAQLERDTFEMWLQERKIIGRRQQTIANIHLLKLRHALRLLWGKSTSTAISQPLAPE